MWPYWIFFLFPAIAAVKSRPARNLRFDGTRKISANTAWGVLVLALTIIIGFRDRVGGDWYNYFGYLFRAKDLTFVDALLQTDPGFELINVLSMWMDLGVVGVNLFCGFVFALGLVIYCRSLPRPWLALAVAIPYLTIVVSMGYSRQGVAIGFAMIALVALGRDRFVSFLLWIAVAATFHSSAVLLIALSLLTLNFRKLRNLPVLFVVAPLLYVAFLQDRTADFTTAYLDEAMQSDGAFLRLSMNLVPGILFLFFRRRLFIADGEKRIYTVMSLAAAATFVALITGLLPSTALDRTALYLIPLQLYVFSHLPDALGKPGGWNQAYVFGIVVFYAAVQFVWLNLGTFSGWWIPYRMFPPLDIREAVQQPRHL